MWIVLALLPFGLFAQGDYWQQKVEYRMEFNLDVNTHLFQRKTNAYLL